MMLKRTELRVGRKKHGISALIPEDIDEQELDLCAVCDKREPPEKPGENDAPIDWVQCDSCLTWVHLECINTRECVCCGNGDLEIGDKPTEEVQQANQLHEDPSHFS